MNFVVRSVWAWGDGGGVCCPHGTCAPGGGQECWVGVVGLGEELGVGACEADLAEEVEVWALLGGEDGLGESQVHERFHFGEALEGGGFGFGGASGVGE